MPQLRMVPNQQPLTFGVAVAVPVETRKRPSLVVAVGDGTGRSSTDARFRLPIGDIVDLGAVMGAAWQEFWYGEPERVASSTERALRLYGLDRSVLLPD